MAESQDQTTVIGADSHFKGEMTFEKTARIIGRFDGKISGKGELQVAQSATCKADIDASVANIDGNIEGNIHAKDAVKLNPNSRVKGDITASKMTMAEGASFYGMCAVGPDASKGSVSGGPNTGGGSGGAPQGGQAGGPNPGAPGAPNAPRGGNPNDADRK